MERAGVSYCCPCVASSRITALHPGDTSECQATVSTLKGVGAHTPVSY